GGHWWKTAPLIKRCSAWRAPTAYPVCRSRCPKIRAFSRIYPSGGLDGWNLRNARQPGFNRSPPLFVELARILACRTDRLADHDLDEAGLLDDAAPGPKIRRVVRQGHDGIARFLWKRAGA